MFSVLWESLNPVDDLELPAGGESAGGGAVGPRPGLRRRFSNTGRRTEYCQVIIVNQLHQLQIVMCDGSRNNVGTDKMWEDIGFIEMLRFKNFLGLSRIKISKIILPAKKSIRFICWIAFNISRNPAGSEVCSILENILVLGNSINLMFSQQYKSRYSLPWCLNSLSNTSSHNFGENTLPFRRSFV